MRRNEMVGAQGARTLDPLIKSKRSSSRHSPTEPVQIPTFTLFLLGFLDIVSRLSATPGTKE
jgi:hypothetical protein